MAEIINSKESETLRTIVGGLVKKEEENTIKLNEVHAAQEKMNSTLEELITAKKTGAPVIFMRSNEVEKAIKENLNSQFVNSAVQVKVPEVSIGNQSMRKIDGLIAATERLVESNKAIKPRRPLFSLTIRDGKKVMWFWLSIAVIGIIWAIVSNRKVNSIQDQAFYWGYRAYQTEIRRDKTNPGDAYHLTVSHFKEMPDNAKEYVEMLEMEANRYQEMKQYLLSIIKERDSRDIRVLEGDRRYGEGWYRYRFFDEEIWRFVHIWPNGKAEETTDKIVTDLASAQKYSKRNIWITLREATPITSK